MPDPLPETVVGAAAAALFDGRIVIAGGTSGTFDSVMLFTPSAAGSAGYPFGTFTLWDQLDGGRLGAAAAPLPSGRLLLVGGCDIVANGGDGPVGTCAHAPDSAETLGLSGPFNKSTAVPPALKPYGPVAVPMADGLTMVSAGGDPILEFYSPPPANSFSLVQGSGAGPSEAWAAGAPLLDGDALFAGGSPTAGGVESQALLFMPAAEAAIPYGLRFSNVQVGSKAVAALVVTNVGGQPLVISGVSLAGRGAPDYTIKNGCAGRRVTFGQSCTLTVRFKPKAAGHHWATFTVQGNSITTRTYKLFGDAVSTGTAPSTALPTGGPGAVRVVTCRRVNGARRCTKQLIAATATFTIARAKVILSRSGVTYARGIAWLTNLFLSARRTIPAGLYTLKFLSQDGSKTVSRVVPFRVG